MGTFHENVIYNNIKALCDNRTPRVSFSKMCTDLGISKSLGTKLKENPDKSINGDTAQLIADYFGVSIDCILGEDGNKKTPTPEGERERLKELVFSQLENADPAIREAALRLLGIQELL